MKTLKELYTEIMASDELKAQLAKVTDGEGLAAFAAANGVEATAEECLAFLAEKSRSRELSADDLDAAAGGFIVGGDPILSSSIPCKWSYEFDIRMVNNADGIPEPTCTCIASPNPACYD